MILDLIQKPQKIEPKSILYFRRFVILILLSLTITLFVILCINIANENAVISSSIISYRDEGLSAPGKNCY
jgi:hypothetical protein